MAERMQHYAVSVRRVAGYSRPEARHLDGRGCAARVVRLVKRFEEDLPCG